MVHLDPRKQGVRVPERFISDPVLRLNFAYGFNLPGFVVDDEGVAAVLNFNKERFSCSIPWSAVFAITSPEGFHPGRIWTASLPPELLAQWLAEKRRRKSDEEKPQTDARLPDNNPPISQPRSIQSKSESKSRRPSLRVVSPSAEDESGSENPLSTENPPTDPSTPPPKPPLRPKLRLV